MNNSKLYFRYGTMNSGKSLQLLATAYNFQERGVPFLVIKSRIDTRDGEDIIHSRALGDRVCTGIQSSDNIFKIISEKIADEKIYYKWILVDEAQFLTEHQVDELSDVVDKLEINVICYGLRSDFKTKLFPGSKRLFEIADTIEEIKSTCSCGKKTTYNARIDSDGNIITTGKQVEIGGEDKYISMCRKCYKEKLSVNKLKN